MSVVIDASVLVALVIGGEKQGAARSRLERWLDEGEHLHVPAVLPYEIANVLARRVVDGRLSHDDVVEIWQDLSALDLRVHPFDLTRDGSEVATITARLRRRHATDATYVCLSTTRDGHVDPRSGAGAQRCRRRSPGHRTGLTGPTSWRHDLSTSISTPDATRIAATRGIRTSWWTR